MLTGCATVFVVSDLAAGLAYYRDTLGFAATFVYGEPNYYACLYRADVSLHIVASTHTKRLAGQGAVCLFVDDVDAVHGELIGRGAKVSTELGDRAYGMRDFNVTDLDGNQITVGMASK